jgi:HEPN domain-containing protein
MSTETDFRAWAEYAEADYDAACTMLRRRRPLNNHACYCSQQCAEKYLKAMLVFRGVVVPRTHDLIRLSELCASVGILVAVDLKNLNTLSEYAIAARYPGDAPTIEEARDALTVAKAVRRFSRKYLGLMK